MSIQKHAPMKFINSVLLKETAKTEKVKKNVICMTHIFLEATWEGLTFGKIVIFCVVSRS